MARAGKRASKQADRLRPAIGPPLPALVFALAVFAGLLVVGSGCGDSPARPAVDAARFSRHATVRESSGQIVLPLNRYSLHLAERRTVDYAYALAIDSCLSPSDFHYPVFDRRDEPVAPSRLYGLWDERSARRFGYAPPPESAPERQLDRWMQHDRSPTEEHALGECARSAASLQVPEPLPGDVAAFRLSDDARRAPAAREAIDDWHACLASQGLYPPAHNAPWLEPRAPRRVATKRVALIDVHCKQRVRLVYRLARAAAQVQGSWIERHQGLLARQRAVVERVVDRASAVIERQERGG